MAVPERDVTNLFEAIKLKELSHLTRYVPNLHACPNPLDDNPYFHPLQVKGFYMTQHDVVLRQIVYDCDLSPSLRFAYHRTGPCKHVFFDPLWFMHFCTYNSKNPPLILLLFEINPNKTTTRTPTLSTPSQATTTSPLLSSPTVLISGMVELRSDLGQGRQHFMAVGVSFVVAARGGAKAASWFNRLHDAAEYGWAMEAASSGAVVVVSNGVTVAANEGSNGCSSADFSLGLGIGMNWGKLM